MREWKYITYYFYNLGLQKGVNNLCIRNQVFYTITHIIWKPAVKYKIKSLINKEKYWFVMNNQSSTADDDDTSQAATSVKTGSPAENMLMAQINNFFKKPE